MSYVTIYTQTIRRRKGPDAGRTVTVGCMYKTKSLTKMHENIRKTFPDAITYEDPKSVVTDLIPGMNIGCLPIVIGGKRIAPL